MDQVKEQNRMNAALLNQTQSLIMQNEPVLSMLAAQLGLKTQSHP